MAKVPETSDTEPGARRKRRRRGGRRRRGPRRPEEAAAAGEASEGGGEEAARPRRQRSRRRGGSRRGRGDAAAAEAKPAPKKKAAPRRPPLTAVSTKDTEPREPDSVEGAAGRLGIEQLYPEQEQVIEAVQDGSDVLMVLPTGFGKSACYQVPSMVLEEPSLVISPLLALMRDQYEKLVKLEIPCVRIDGTVRGKRREEALARITMGGPLLVMTTPESLATVDVCEALGKSGVALAAVDEAHCISEWGYDFRPAYLQIGERLRALGDPPVLALTATATEKVRTAIQRFLGMEDVEVVASSPHRENLAYDVVECGGGERLRALVRLALRVRRPGIIYCSTTRDVDEVYTVLQRFGIPSHRYHGKMTNTERAREQDAFMRRGKRSVMIATSAFGLGIDKPDIRYVIHYQSPASLEQYVQEAGRAGRDGRRSNCILLWGPEDREIHESLLSRSRVRPDQLYKVGRALAAWAAEEKTPSLDALAISAELGTRTVGALCALLEEAELVKWDQTAVFVTVPADEIEERARELAGQFETLRSQDARRLDAVGEYAHGQECRAAFLCNYFGEEIPDPCGLCDVCRGQSGRPDRFFEPLARPKAATARLNARSKARKAAQAKEKRRAGGGRRRRRGGRRSRPRPDDS